MKIIRHLKSISILAIFSVMICCGGDNDTGPVKSRDIKIEVSGNFVGTLSATYINASGGGTNESISSLPWTKTIVYSSSVPSMGISVGGTNGTPGQTIRIKIFAADKLVSDTPGTADNSGTVVVTSPSYIF